MKHVSTASSLLSKSSEISFTNLSFIKEGKQLEYDDTYNLINLAEYYEVDATDLENNNAAKKVLINRNFEKRKAKQMQIVTEPLYVFLIQDVVMIYQKCI